MKKSYILLGIVGMAQVVFACDICGCANPMIFGLNDFENQSYIGLKHQLRSYQTTHPAIFNLPCEVSNERFYSVDILAKWAFKKNWNVAVHLPYRLNRQIGKIDTLKVKGWSDVALFLGYSYSILHERSKSTYAINGGVKFPTGKYQKNSTILRNMQVGTGSFDFLIQASYSCEMNRFKSQIQPQYLIKTSNSEGFKFGNVSSWISTSWISILRKSNPLKLIVRGEFYDFQKDITKFKSVAETYNSGKILAIGGGIQWSFKKWSAQAISTHPVFQTIGKGNIKQLTSLQIAVAYSFKNEKK
jgi:hypothetical protein